MSMINTLVTAVVAALQAAPAVSSRVERVRLRALPAGTSTAVVVRPLSSEVLASELSTGQPYVWDTQLVVECYARAQQGTAADVAVDALVSAVYARLLADTTLGGAAVVLQPQSIAYDFDVDGESVVCASIQFIARQRTVGNSL
ncbi:MAG: hypothetical protein N2690_07285 [Rhodocyclaceae bacterium]|nr:hypothetical protein [Rhodocyclaceae bacterium]